MKNYYKILGVLPSSNTDEIKSAYREKARKFHPDTSQYDSLAEFLQVQEAYETLCEPKKRKYYDIQLKKSQPNHHQWEMNLRQSPPSRSVNNDPWNFIQNDFFQFADWYEEESNNHKFLEIILSPKEALEGTVITFEIPFAYTCPFCLGTGEVFFQVCSKCNGTGKKKISREFHLKLPGGQKEGNHLVFNLTNSEMFRIRLNVTIKVLDPETILSEIL